ncbi:LysR family transcriptional regulator [Steroidobacter sp.]|uniref:LysR family transcriptional regulator n=1 Tax=Steroidobacter sp. TaxID=1978227 RepID=UPI001A434BBF|nr:LysR family transcriptional regulator [Steroidobacter sp.]MBL8266799.1 LysR family transcriptional regulator [Steroidobacter sp.]
MDIRWLQDFLTIAETGNFTRAAEIRNSSQAAFSRRIQSLEQWLGVPLIDRSAFPTKLTPEGERFRERAAEIVLQVADAKTSLTGAVVGRGQQVRIALPHALATGRLAAWWAEWGGLHMNDVTCTAVPGNVHDTVTALVSGNADLLICFHTAEQPIHLSAQYERVVIGAENLRPYVAASLAANVQKHFPGTQRAPLSLLMYSSGAYLGRMVDLIIESVRPRLIGRCVFEADMADVLRNLCVEGRGVAWLPDCSAEGAPPGSLVALEGWSQSMSVVAYRDRQARNPKVERLWPALSGKKPAQARKRKRDA